MKNISTAILALLFLCLFIQCEEKAEKLYDSSDAFLEEVSNQVQHISPVELQAILDTADYYMLVDVREEMEHNTGFIEGSVNISRGLLEFKFKDEAFWLSKDMEEPYDDDLIVVYGRKNGRAILASATIQKMGFTNVRYLEGGYKAWESNFPNAYVRDEED